MASKALVTGASSGLGAIYADRLARRGYDLVLVARDKARLEALAARLRQETGVAVEILAADLTDKADLATVEGRIADVALLVNNAGMAIEGGLLEPDPAQVQTLIDLNISAATRLAIAAAKAFAAKGAGAIINISSALAINPERFNGVYGGSKAHLLAFSQALNREAGPKGVRVQVVLPGATRTEIWERSGRDPAKLDPARTMNAEELVDAALAGFDMGELVTIPSLPDADDWAAFEKAREKLFPNLSRNHPAARYTPGK